MAEVSQLTKCLFILPTTAVLSPVDNRASFCILIGRFLSEHSLRAVVAFLVEVFKDLNLMSVFSKYQMWQFRKSKEFQVVEDSAGDDVTMLARWADSMSCEIVGNACGTENGDLDSCDTAEEGIALGVTWTIGA